MSSIEILASQMSPCEPQEGSIVEKVDYHWATLARACQATAPPTACDETTICVPTSEPPPPGFEQCIFLPGEDAVECPLGYPNRYVFYSAIDTDSLTCTPCACGSPEGGACEAAVSAWSEPGCIGTTVAAEQVSSTTPQCSNAVPGYDLASMEATWVQNVPGSCQASGGEPLGEAKPSGPATFCCQTRPRG